MWADKKSQTLPHLDGCFREAYNRRDDEDSHSRTFTLPGRGRHRLNRATQSSSSAVAVVGVVVESRIITLKAVTKISLPLLSVAYPPRAAV